MEAVLVTDLLTVTWLSSIRMPIEIEAPAEIDALICESLVTVPVTVPPGPSRYQVLPSQMKTYRDASISE
jgi:hypothetical protein